LIGEADLLLPKLEFENTINELYGFRTAKEEKLKNGSFNFRSLAVYSEEKFAHVFTNKSSNRCLVIISSFYSQPNSRK
jgi:putative SOS response-associated peptidase YedK